MNLEEIKAREQKATPGPWNVGNGSRKSFMVGKNAVVAPFRVIADRNIYSNLAKGADIAFNTQTYLDIEFIAHARTDIPALISEVERLTMENQGLRANSMIQEHIITGGRDTVRDEKIMHLIMDNAAKDQQIATLKKALELMHSDFELCHTGQISSIDGYIHQAQQLTHDVESEGKK